MDKPINDCALFKSAFKYSPDAIILTDLDGYITDVNQAFVDLYGWQKTEILGKNTSIVRSEKTDDAFIRDMWKSINESGRWQGEITNKNKDGKLIPILLTITQIIRDGQKIGYMGLDIDMTNQLKMQERIAQSQRLATIGKMASKIAHEIRNPLSSISLNAELLEDEMTSDTLDKDEAKLLLKSIMSEVDRLAKLTNEYLQFSRLPRLQSSEHDICSLINNLVLLIENEIKATKIEMNIQLPDKPVILNMDKDQIHRMLLNLIRNSIEALPNGGLISVGVVQKNSHIEIDLQDNGAGIPEDQLDRIFEPFYTTKNLGTGLGLSISRQIIEEHDGVIQYITKNSGANFLITLPIK
ncbi:MAG: PAS domain S-box protein [Calditrichaeota bacterium]|nr:MAG: PAS domain S-box protein [Calditrichota bacterium]MBL1204967.1 PAS domain S-box protein [Calditrichota bacterium]NOG44797.1 PAS domain S-box protein [Calditrichota bacterium]